MPWAQMMQAFPDTRVFVNHRDLPSIGSLFLTFRRLDSDSAVDPRLLGPATLAGLAKAMDRVTAWRAAHPEVQVIDFGLDEDAIEAACGRYLDRFGVTRERRR